MANSDNLTLKVAVRNKANDRSKLVFQFLENQVLGIKLGDFAEAVDYDEEDVKAALLKAWKTLEPDNAPASLEQEEIVIPASVAIVALDDPETFRDLHDINGDSWTLSTFLRLKGFCRNRASVSDHIAALSAQVDADFGRWLKSKNLVVPSTDEVLSVMMKEGGDLMDHYAEAFKKAASFK